MTRNELASRIAQAIYTGRNGKWDYRMFMSQSKPYMDDAEAALSIIEPILREALDALGLVIDTVSGCHDCWESSASDEEKKQVVGIVTTLRSILEDK